MFRLTVIFINIFTFFFAQISFALQANELQKYSDFFHQTEVTKRAVPLKEIHQKFGSELPQEIRTQMEHYLKENPDLIIPKLDVQKMGSEIQITSMTDQENLVLRTKSDHPQIWATVVGTKNGKEVKEEIPYSIFVQGAEYIYQQRITEEMRRLKLLTATEYKKLNSTQKQKYIHLIRKVMEEAEAVQNGFQKNKTVSVLDLIIENAWALEEDCIIAGYVGNYYSTDKCKLPKGNYSRGNCAVGKTQCNPVLYGPGICIGESNKVPYWATAECNQNSKAINVIPKLESITDEESFNQVLKGVKEKVSTLQKKCNDEVLPQFKQNKIGKDQEKTCQKLIERVEEINKLQCSEYEKVVTSFKCQPVPPPAAPAQKLAESKPQQAGATAAGESAKPAQSQTAQTIQCGEGADGAKSSSDGSPQACPAPSSSGVSDSSAAKASSPVVGSPAQQTATKTEPGVDGVQKSESLKDAKSEEKTKETGAPATATPSPSSEKAKESVAGTQPEKMTSKEKEDKQKNCDELHKIQGNLKCGPNPTKKLSCEFGEVYYCACTDSKEARGNGKIDPAYPVECQKSEPSRKSEKSSTRSRSKPQSSPILKTVASILPAALMGLYMYVLYSAQKKQMQKYYDMYQQNLQSYAAPVYYTPTTTTGGSLTAPPAGGSR